MNSRRTTTPTDRQFYRALAARDARFDGVFFVGVRSTGIYCRPICPARTPQAAHCSFFVTAAAAERRGFRPCLRCRPELANGQLHEAVAAVDIVRERARHAGARIASGALDHASLDALAAELGVCSRHLRRVVEREFGASPVALAQTLRLLTAKQLLTETTLPVSAIAMASGFGSVRRLNALFQARYRLSPSALRPAALRAVRGHNSSATTTPVHRSSATSTGHASALLEHASISLTLSARAPFHWSDMCAYLQGRAMTGVEMVTLTATPQYSRVVRYGAHVGVVTVSERAAVRTRATRTTRATDTTGDAYATQNAVVLNVRVSLSLLPVLVPVLARLRAMLDVDAAPHIIGEHLSTTPFLRSLVEARPGMRVPGTMDSFELAVRAVLGQQVSVRGATTLASRLAEKLCSSRRFDTHTADGRNGAAHHSHSTTFPALTHEPISPDRLAGASLTQLTDIGLTRARAQCVLALARAVADGELPELGDSESTHAPLAQFEARITSLPGIGPWTAQYIAMRALRYPDAFPDTDLALRKAAGGVTSKALGEQAQAWRPWRAYAAMHLWASLA